jgi:hypothetical protein
MLNKKFQSVTSAIASYDYKDLAEGIGTFIFYGAIDDADVGILTGQQVYSAKVETYDVGTATYNLTFTSTIFNTPNDISGTAYITFCTRCTSEDTTMTSNVVLNLVSGGTTTQLLSLSGSSWDTSVSQWRTNLFRDVITTTHIKGGDYLTLNVWGECGEGSIGIGHDPMDRDGIALVPSTENVTTKLILFAPFKVDVS